MKEKINLSDDYPEIHLAFTILYKELIDNEKFFLAVKLSKLVDRFVSLQEEINDSNNDFYKSIQVDEFVTHCYDLLSHAERSTTQNIVVGIFRFLSGLTGALVVGTGLTTAGVLLGNLAAPVLGSVLGLTGAFVGVSLGWALGDNIGGNIVNNISDRIDIYRKKEIEAPAFFKMHKYNDSKDKTAEEKENKFLLSQVFLDLVGPLRQASLKKTEAAEPEEEAAPALPTSSAMS